MTANPASDILNGVLASLDAPQATEEDRPLRWDGHSWSRTGKKGLDPFMAEIPAEPIAQGWWVESMSQTWGEEFQPIPRAGLVLDVHVDDDGELSYICIEQHQRFIHRLDVVSDDVRSAHPSRRMVSTMRDAVVKALAGDRRYELRCSKSWLEGVYGTLLSMRGPR